MSEKPDVIESRRRVILWPLLRNIEAQERSLPTLWSLLVLWSRISIQSIGGGSSTLFLIRREFIERRLVDNCHPFRRMDGLADLLTRLRFDGEPPRECGTSVVDCRDCRDHSL